MIRTALALLVAGALVAGCGGESSSKSSGPVQKGGTLRLATLHDVTDFNPFTMTDNDSIRAVSQITEGLYKTDARGKVVPWLATGDQTSADGLTHTMKLRPGVKFSTGKPVTSSDVKWTLQKVQGGETWSFLMTNIKSIGTPKPDTVVIKLKQPSAALHAVLALFANGIVPANYGGEKESAFAQKPIGTGPFQVARWDKGSKVVLERNPTYWRKGFPKLDKVELIGVPDDSGRISQLRGKQVDVAVSPPWPQVKSLQSAGGLGVGIYAPSQIRALALNTKKAPFDDAKVREAVSLALDRNAMIDAALAGNGKPAGSFLAPSVPYSSGEQDGAADVAQAKSLMQQAGNPTATVEVILPSGEQVFNTVAQIAQQNLQAIGLKVKLVSLDQAAALEKYQEGDYTATVTGITSDILDPSELVSYYVASEGFTTGVDTKPVAKLASQAEQEADESRRAQLYAELQQKVADEHAFVPLMAVPYSYGVSDTVKGFAVNGTGIFDLSNVGVAKGS